MTARWLGLSLALLLAACTVAPTSAPTRDAPASVVTLAPNDPLLGRSVSGRATPSPPASPVSPGGLPASALPAASLAPGTPAMPPPPAGSPLPATAPLKLVAMGASDVVGLGADAPATEGWAPVLAGLLEARTQHPTALTKLGFLGRLAKELRSVELPRAIAAQPDVVVLWTGPNDIMRAVSLADFQQDLDAIVIGLVGTRAQVYVINLPALDRLPFFAEFKADYAVATPIWQAEIARVATSHGATPVDLAAFSAELDAHPDYLWGDGFHPSTKGYQRLATILADVVAPHLR